MGKPKKGRGSGVRNTNRRNGKAPKKNPKQPKAKKPNINGRSLEDHKKREAWKAWKANQSDTAKIPHWKEWQVDAA